MAIGDPPFGYWLGGILPPSPEAQIDPEKVARHREIQALQNEVASLRERLEVLEKFCVDHLDLKLERQLEEDAAKFDAQLEEAALDWGGDMARPGYTPKMGEIQKRTGLIPAPAIMTGMEDAKLETFEVSCGGVLKEALAPKEAPPVNYPVFPSNQTVERLGQKLLKVFEKPVCSVCGEKTSHVPNGMHCRGKS